MEWGIEEADGDRGALCGLEHADEVVALVGEEFLEGFGAGFGFFGDDHLAEGGDAVAFEEHVLGAAEADALGTEVSCSCDILGCVGVGADLECAVLVGPAHDLGEVAREFGLDAWDFAGHDGAGGAVDGDEVVAAEGLVQRPLGERDLKREFAFLVVGGPGGAGQGGHRGASGGGLEETTTRHGGETHGVRPSRGWVMEKSVREPTIVARRGAECNSPQTANRRRFRSAS